LALCLLERCDLRLLQSTIIGVVLIRLLLRPGMAYVVGGFRVAHQELHPRTADLNQTLLTTGVVSLLLPAAFFAALERDEPVNVSTGIKDSINDNTRGDILKISRGLSFILLAVYVSSRFFIYRPPGEEHGLHHHKDAPEGLKEMVKNMKAREPEVNPWACLIVLGVALGLMAVTAEFLVESIEPVREQLEMKQEWFGLIVLPIVSFSADAILAVVYFVRYNLRDYFGAPITPATTLAEARSIELGIQFLIFWTPVLVLLAWISQKPFSLLFDIFEVTLLLGACFLANYVMADAKTNYAEGLMLISLYMMIALTAYFYPGQRMIDQMLACGTVREAVLATLAANGNSTHLGIHHAPSH